MFISLSSGEEATIEQTVFILQKNCIGSFWSKKLHSGPDLQKNCIWSLIYCSDPGHSKRTLLYPCAGRILAKAQKCSILAPKFVFLIWDRDFRHWPVCSPRRCGRFGTFRTIFQLFVSELWPFSWPPGPKNGRFWHVSPV